MHGSILGLEPPTRTAAPVVNVLNKTGDSSIAIYEAGSQTRRTIGWNAQSVSPNAAVLSTLATLRDRSRTATRNNGFAKGAIDKLVTNIIGTGIKPLSQATDPAIRKAIQALWTKWTDESDADGLLDFYGQQAQAVRGFLEAGDDYIRLRSRLPEDGLSVPMQLQVLEPELCPYTYNLVTSTTRIRAGIEFDGIGRRIAYWFHPSRPGDLFDYDASQLRRVPAESVIHLYDPLRPGQLRGIPHLTQALIKLNELDKFDDATLLRQQLANLFVAFLTKSTAGDGVNMLTGETIETDGEGKPLVPMAPGLFQELGVGEDVKFSEPPGTSDGYKDFMKQQLLAVSAATGVPYEALTGDMSGVNDRTVRVVFNEFRLRIQMVQHHLIAFQLCRPVWRAWMDAAVLSGALPVSLADYRSNPDAYLAVTWTPPRTPYIHPVQDVEAQQAAIRAGLTSRSAIVSELGEDAESIDEQQAADNQRADEYRLKYDSDARYAKSVNGVQKTTTTDQPGTDGQAGAAAA
jgi:lambda family phage portal protein